MSRKRPFPARAAKGKPSRAANNEATPEASQVASALAPARNSNYRELFQRIERRNGEIVDFDKSRITEAIWKAARSVGGSDHRTADLLADKVILYLSRTHDDHLLTIEEVQDAVEKVLIEQGHAKTAKAYILYRQERSRVRKFRDGRRSLEAAPPFESSPGQQVEVLTSGEQLVRWDRERIARALVRETGLAWSLADRVSREVEKQIIYSKTSRLTAPLVREMVNVKLLEYGYHRERQLHSRLGVPLYDVEQMVQGRWEEGQGDPLEQALSGSVLRQYVLGRVYSGEVAEAHLRGDLYLHGLTEPWRVTESIQPLEYLKKANLSLPDFSGCWAPAETAFELIGRLGKFNALLDGGVRRRCLWDGVNVFLAPFLDGQDEGLLREVARALLFEMSVRSSGAVRRGPMRSLGFYFHIPRGLWNTAALGPGARYSGKTYAYYEETSRRFLEIFLNVQSEGDSQGQPFPGLEFCFHLDRAFFDSPLASDDLQMLESHLPQTARWCGWFHGPGGLNEQAKHFCAAEASPGNATAYKYPWKMRSSIGPVITLNLPALAIQAEGDAEELSALLEQQVHLGFTAFRQRHEFLGRLSVRDGKSPTVLLYCRGDGEPFLRPAQQRARLALWGLAEMAEWLTGRSFVQEPECRQFARRVLRELVQKVELCAQSCRLPCEVALETDPQVAARLGHCTPGRSEASAEHGWSIPPRSIQEALEFSDWNALLTAAGQITLAPAQLVSADGELSLAQLFGQLAARDREERLVVSRPFRICQACSRLLQGSPDICPHCGSLQLEPLE